mgnify:FL=1
MTYGTGSQQTVQWDVAGTDANGVNVSHVNILLSDDDGQTFGTTLLANTPNDGSELVTIPNILTNQARIKVEAVGNIFFNINTANFTIAADDHEAGITAIINPVPNHCGLTVEPVVTITNNATNTLTSATINYNVLGALNHTFNWTGALASGASEDVTLPSISVVEAPLSFTAFTTNPNGNADINPGNDTSSVIFVPTASHAVTFELTPDLFGSEITWTLKDSTETVIESGGPYAGVTTTITRDWCLDEGCYTFEIFDSFGDGICLSLIHI